MSETWVDERYRIEDTLGEGGMGSVHAVHDVSTGQRVALKQTSANAPDVVRELFELEYRVLSTLRHPRVVRTYDFGVSAEGPYYTMEILQGADLSKSAPMPWRRVCLCLRDVASILGLLHARQLVHRDLGPRNVWMAEDGRIKMLDFGAVAPFGPSQVIVGTPPLVPPEALQGAALDARTDLYALGALGYWLLTSTHAFRATKLGELKALWERPPARPSELAALVRPDPTDAIPKALDELILSLLALDPAERPATTLDVIDRLNAIAALAPETHGEVVAGYLESRPCIGRQQELTRLMRRVRRSHEGRPSSTLITGPEGIGCSRLLEEAALRAATAGSTVLRASAFSGSEAYAGAVALGLDLLRALPQTAREACRQDQSLLEALSPRLAQALGNAGQRRQHTPAGRAERQQALHRWLLTVSARRPLCVVVDDVDRLDEETQALLATLALAPAGARLCLIVAARDRTDEPLPDALRSLHEASTSMGLKALSLQESGELLRSMFGEVPLLDRLALQLHGLAAGNPGHCLLLAQHLVQRGTIEYEAGTWRLPRQLRDEDLPAHMHEGVVAALDELSPAARTLARRLAVPDHGALTPDLVEALAGPLDGLAAPVRELMRRKTLHRRATAYAFVHAAQREHLFAELPVEEQRQVHRKAAQYIERVAQGDPLQRLRSAVHWLLAGQPAHAEPHLHVAGEAYTQGVVSESLRQAAPMFAEAERLLRAYGRSEERLCLPLGALALAGYFVDRRYAETYGVRAIDTLSRCARLPLATRLRPWLGRKLSLLCALIVAGFRLRSVSHAPRLPHLLYCLVAAATATAGCAGVAIDPVTVRERSRVLHILGVLRSAGIVRVLADFNEGMALGLEGRTTEARRLLLDVVDRLQAPGAFPDMHEVSRTHYIGGALGICAAYEALDHDARCLARADEVERCGPVHAVWADQVRALYWHNMGDAKRASHFERCVAVGGVQNGNAWHVDAWTMLNPAVSLHEDAVSIRHALDEIRELARTQPRYRQFVAWNWGAYLAARGRFEEAIETIQSAAPGATPLLGWSPMVAWVARSYNALGNHRRALDVCEAEMARVRPDDFRLLNQGFRLELERAVALAGLGDAAAAHAVLDGVAALHLPTAGPVTQGYLELARARVFTLGGDTGAARNALAAAEAAWTPLQVATLGEQLGRARRAIDMGRVSSPPIRGQLVSSDAHLVTRLRLRLQGEETAEGRARMDRVLAVVLELTGAQHALLHHRDLGDASSDGKPRPAVIQWLQQRMAASATAQATAVLGPASDMGADSEEVDVDTLFELGSDLYRSSVLLDELGEPVMALALAQVPGPPACLPAAVDDMLVRYLAA